jgi:hypothetical protein
MGLSGERRYTVKFIAYCTLLLMVFMLLAAGFIHLTLKHEHNDTYVKSPKSHTQDDQSHHSHGPIIHDLDHDLDSPAANPYWTTHNGVPPPVSPGANHTWTKE